MKNCYILQVTLSFLVGTFMCFVSDNLRYLRDAAFSVIGIRSVIISDYKAMSVTEQYLKIYFMI
jgi:hypothetical protein